MKTLRIIFGILFPVLLLIGCDNDRHQETIDPTENTIRFKIGFIDDNKLKVATDADFDSTWEIGDIIGLYIVKSTEGLQSSGNYYTNIPLEYTDQGWSSTNMYYTNDGDNLSFYAYYPYDATISDPLNHIFEVSENQDEANYHNKSDLLLAKTENVAKSSNPVSLQFSHAMSLVQVEVVKDISVPDFDNLEVTLTDVQRGTSLNWDSPLTATGSTSTITLKPVEGLNYTYRALVPAQTLSAETKIRFVQNTAGKEIDLEYLGLQSATLTAGKVHKYKVTLINNVIETYAVGDKYPHTGPAIGMVYEISNGGKNGKVISLDQIIPPKSAWCDDTTVELNVKDENNGLNNMRSILAYIKINTKNKDWPNFPVFEWVHNKNNIDEDYSDANAKGVWYLPALEEMKAFNDIYMNYGKTEFNNMLTNANGTPLNHEQMYWTSTEYSKVSSYFVQIGISNYDYNMKANTNIYGRAILQF